MNAAHTLWPWLWLGGGLATLAGYFGPWVPHPAAGLVITGLDLAEYVKFLPTVQSGALSVWRQAFYLPLIAVSVSASLWAFRPHLPWPARGAAVGTALVAAAYLLPPAWTPSSLASPEFRLQTGVLLACLALGLTSPLWALLPTRWAVAAVALLCLAASTLPAVQFWQVLPAIAALYSQPLTPGWGTYLTTAGLASLLVAAVGLARRESAP